MRTRTQTACIQSAINGFYADRIPEPSWEEQFDACVRRLKEIDREEAEMRRRFIDDMRGLLDQAEDTL